MNKGKFLTLVQGKFGEVDTAEGREEMSLTNGSKGTKRTKTPTTQQQSTKTNPNEPQNQADQAKWNVTRSVKDARPSSTSTSIRKGKPNRSLPDCCFLEAGVVALCLRSDFHRIETAACASCQRTVDLSQTKVSEILGSTFAHCAQLQQLSLSQNLQIIEQEAFLNCTSLQEVCTPPSLLYIARRAFAGCTQLRAFWKKGKSKTGPMLLTNASMRQAQVAAAK